MGQVALVASGDQAEGSVSRNGVVQRNQAGHQQATEISLGTATIARVSPRVGLSALSQAAAASHSSNPCPGSNQAKLSSPYECLQMPQHGLQGHGVFQDIPGFDDVEQLGLGAVPLSQGDPAGGRPSQGLEALSRLLDLARTQYFRQEGVSGDIEEVLLVQ